MRGWRWRKYIYIYAPPSRELAEFVKYSNARYNEHGYFFRIKARRKPPFKVELMYYYRSREKGPVTLIVFKDYSELPRDKHTWSTIVWIHIKKYTRIHGFYGSYG